VLGEGGLEGGYRDLGRTVEPEGNPYGADSAIDIELQVAEEAVA
jgi:hypothetical protein